MVWHNMFAFITFKLKYTSCLLTDDCYLLFSCTLICESMKDSEKTRDPSTVPGLLTLGISYTVMETVFVNILRSPSDRLTDL